MAARQYIAEKAYTGSVEDIRLCRQELLAMSKDGKFAQLLAINDFYGTSECRDLIFHVQEHRLTLPTIKAWLNELGLSFIGFSIDSDILKHYSERFPDDPCRTNLDYWHQFELENPTTFIGMYQFRVQQLNSLTEVTLQ